MELLSSNNKNSKYFLCLIDVFIKYTWVKFKVNDRVRVTKYKNNFNKHCTENWSREIHCTRNESFS